MSHLWVTQELWGRRPHTGKDLAEFLGHAESLRRLGEGHRPPKSPPLLNPASTWRMPDRFVLPRWTGSLPHPDELIEAMTAWPDTSAEPV